MIYRRKEITMNIGNQISAIRKEHQLTQEKFGELFHVTRQTVSNWENEKTYPDLQTLIDISDRFEISLDTLLKEDLKMVKAIDHERFMGIIKHKKSVVDFLMGAGGGLIAGALFSPGSAVRDVTIVVALAMYGTGLYLQRKYDKMVFRYMEDLGK